MNNKDPILDNLLNKPIALTKHINLISVALVIVLIAIAITLLATGVLSVESLHHLANSPVWLMVRIALYVVLWFGWEKILVSMGVPHNEALIRQSRRPLLVVLFVYECFFANNILTMLR